MTLSESARMSSAAEARFRIPAPPATARAIVVAALDPSSDRVVAALAERGWSGVTFFPAHRGAERGAPIEQIVDADLVVMVATAGAGTHAAAPIGRACSDRSVPTATFVLKGSATDEGALSATLAQVRPWSLMLVVAGDERYVEDILRSLR